MKERGGGPVHTFPAVIVCRETCEVGKKMRKTKDLPFPPYFFSECWNFCWIKGRERTFENTPFPTLKACKHSNKAQSTQKLTKSGWAGLWVLFRWRCVTLAARSHMRGRSVPELGHGACICRIQGLTAVARNGCTRKCLGLPGNRSPRLHPTAASRGWSGAFGEPKTDLEGARSRIVLCVIH